MPTASSVPDGSAPPSGGRRSRRRAAIRACAWLLAACSGALAAAEPAFDEAPGQDEADALRAESEGKGKRSFVVLPIPHSSPSLGTGAILSAVLYYRPEGSSRPWMTGGGALWTDNGSRGGAVFQKAYLGGDRYRVLLVAGQADLNLRFYGVGSAAADRDASIRISQEPTFYLGDVLRKVADGHYLGLRLRQVDVRTRVPLELPAYPDLELPAAELDVDLAGPGLLYEFDTRDSETNPGKGDFAEVEWQWNLESWGSDRGYSKFTAAYNHYRPLGPDGVLAWRASACVAEADAPFFDLCLFGAKGDLRGYETGQYRDRALLTLQAEYRWRFSPRWGAVFFGGVGGVAPSFGDLGSASALPSGGVGLRFKASKEYDVNVSVDYAVGKDSDAVYFSIGEAF